MSRYTLSLLLVVTVCMAGCSSPGPVLNPARVRSDLVGRTMGSREKCWKIRSADQILEFEVLRMVDEGEQRRYSVLAILADPANPDEYAAQADVVYERSDGRWRVVCVGLKSLERVK